MSDWEGLVIGGVSHKVMHAVDCAVTLVEDSIPGPSASTETTP